MVKGKKKKLSATQRRDLRDSASLAVSIASLGVSLVPLLLLANERPESSPVAGKNVSLGEMQSMLWELREHGIGRDASVHIVYTDGTVFDNAYNHPSEIRLTGIESATISVGHNR